MFELLLPHPRANSETSSRQPRTLIPKILLRGRGFFLRVVRSVPNSPRPGIRIAIPGALYPPPPGGGAAAAEMVNVDPEALDPGEIVEGLKAQVSPAGAVQEREI